MCLATLTCHGEGFEPKKKKIMNVVITVRHNHCELNQGATVDLKYRSRDSVSKWSPLHSTPQPWLAKEPSHAIPARFHRKHLKQHYLIYRRVPPSPSRQYSHPPASASNTVATSLLHIHGIIPLLAPGNCCRHKRDPVVTFCRAEEWLILTHVAAVRHTYDDASLSNREMLSGSTYSTEHIGWQGDVRLTIEASKALWKVNTRQSSSPTHPCSRKVGPCTQDMNMTAEHSTRATQRIT